MLDETGAERRVRRMDGARSRFYKSTFSISGAISTGLALVGVFSLAVSPTVATLPFIEEQIFIRIEQRIFSILAVTYLCAVAADVFEVGDRFPRVKNFFDSFGHSLILVTFASIILYFATPSVFVQILNATIAQVAFFVSVLLLIGVFTLIWRVQFSSIGKALFYAGAFVLTYEVYIFARQAFG